MRYLVLYNSQFVEHCYPGIWGKIKLAFLKFTTRQNAPEMIIRSFIQKEKDFDIEKMECAFGKSNLKIIPIPYYDTLEEFQERKLLEEFFKDQWEEDFHKVKCYFYS